MDRESAVVVLLELKAEGERQVVSQGDGVLKEATRGRLDNEAEVLLTPVAGHAG